MASPLESISLGALSVEPPSLNHNIIEVSSANHTSVEPSTVTPTTVEQTFIKYTFVKPTLDKPSLQDGVSKHSTSRGATSLGVASRDASSSYDTFPRFPDLPAEIQLNIWKSALPEPQIIPITLHHNADSGQNEIQFTTKHKPSGLLRACVDSRAVILKVFNVAIKSDDSERLIRLDGRRDIVILGLHKSSFVPYRPPYFGVRCRFRLSLTAEFGPRFKGVETLSWVSLQEIQGDWTPEDDIWAHTQFPGLKRWIYPLSYTSDFKFETVANGLPPGFRFREWEEGMSPHFENAKRLISSIRRQRILSTHLRNAILDFKKDKRPDWEIPEVKLMVPTCSVVGIEGVFPDTNGIVRATGR